MSRQPKTSRTTPAAADRSALRRPPHPDLPPRLSPAQARDAVHKVVTELHATGAVDAGNAEVIDGWLDSLSPQWHAHARTAATEQAAFAQQVVGESEAAALAARQRADAARAELAHTERLVTAYEQALLPSDGREQPDRRHRRPVVDQLDGLTSSRWAGLGRVALMALVAVGDVVAFWMTLQGVFGQDRVVTGLLVGSFTLASMMLMHAAGHTAKSARAGETGLGTAGAVVLGMAWIGLGGVAYVLRMNAADRTTTSAVPTFGADPAAAASTGTDPLLAALLLAGLFVASGVLAFWLGFSGHHPRITAYRKHRAHQSEQREELAEAERVSLTAERLLQNARDEQARASSRAADAALSIDAGIAELKQLARIHLAGLIGQPASTNAVTTDRGDRPAAPPDAGSPSARTGPRHAADAPWGSVPVPVNGHARPATNH